MSRSGRTLDQERAADALTHVRALQQENRYGNYRSYVERLPAQIVMNGLGQAMAMVRSRAPDRANGVRTEDERAYWLVFNQLQTWLCRDHESAPYRGARDLLAAVVERDQDAYVRAHAEALAYLEWLKKFARAFLARGTEAG